ncbi:MAG: transglutaminase [Deltaproteobacteria bacterium]|nr:transglutaminase [Deltaproteobacteria bacterium]
MTGPGSRAIYPLILALTLTPAVSVTYKVVSLGYSLADVLPKTQYSVALLFRFDGHGEAARVRTFLPASDARQTISSELEDSPDLSFEVTSEGGSRVATWSGSSIPDGTEARFRYDVIGRAIRFELDRSITVPPSYPASVTPFLRPEPAIQVDDPLIEKKLFELGADNGPMVDRLRKIFEYSSSLTQRPFKGTTDAMTALRLGEASCNGKSRLFAALARRSGIPSRLVGGLILEQGVKRTSHQWVEAYVGGHWIPFCPTNGHFAELPETYLTFYVGDEALFRKTADINFDYHFDIESTPVPSERAKSSFRVLNVWALFDRLGLPFTLLRTLLLLPLGALVVVLFRNVIGMPTFGTFLPALIAAATTETGAAWGVVGVLVIVLAVSLIRSGVQKLRILHSPGLAILLTAVAVTMLATSAAAEALGLRSLSRVSMFPVAVMAITAERFYLTLVEKGGRPAFKELIGTIVVMLSCHLLMSSVAMQVLVLGFPEILLLAIAANLYLGRWVGIRVAEYLRFRHLLFGGSRQ